MEAEPGIDERGREKRRGRGRRGDGGHARDGNIEYGETGDERRREVPAWGDEAEGEAGAAAAGFGRQLDRPVQGAAGFDSGSRGGLESERSRIRKTAARAQPRWRELSATYRIQKKQGAPRGLWISVLVVSLQVDALKWRPCEGQAVGFEMWKGPKGAKIREAEPAPLTCTRKAKILRRIASRRPRRNAPRLFLSSSPPFSHISASPASPSTLVHLLPEFPILAHGEAPPSLIPVDARSIPFRRAPRVEPTRLRNQQSCREEVLNQPRFPSPSESKENIDA